jgi:glucose-1-phosphate thymidylyltransferase
VEFLENYYQNQLTTDNIMIKGIILAGGTGSRMLPITQTVSKQLLPVYDKPMIYYSISTLMLAGIREILIITASNESELFKKLLGDGHQWGVKFEYAVQPIPVGIPQAFIIGETFIGENKVCLMLGDNLLYGQGLQGILTKAIQNHTVGATLFAYPVGDPERYGIVVLDENKKPVSITEKPAKPASNLAIIGMYFYDNQVIEISKNLKPSVRGELEITAVNQHYLDQQQLNVVNLGRGMAWLDTGTPEALLDASNFINVIEKRQGFKICCPEEIAWRLNYIDDNQYETLALHQQKSSYGKYLLGLLKLKICFELT